MENISPTLKSKVLLKERIKNNLPVYDGGLWENPLPIHQKIKESLITNINKKSYTNIQGEEGFQKIVKSYYKTDSYTPDFSLVGNGLKPLIYLLLTCWQKKVIILTPCWVTYLEDVKILKKDYLLVENIKENNYHLNLEKLEETFKENPDSLLFFNNPCNPTGIVNTADEIKKLAELCQKYNITVFEDQIYYHMSQINTVSITKFYDKVIIGSSLSKDWALGGWRFGWFLFSKKLEELFHKIKSIGSSMYSCPSHFLNDVGVTAIKLLKEDPNYFNDMKKYFLKIQKEVVSKVSQTKLIYSNPEGAWYIWLDFTNYKHILRKLGIKNSDDLMFYLMNNFGIMCVTGKAFGIDYISLRVSLVKEEIIQGMIILEKWLNNIEKYYIIL